MNSKWTLALGFSAGVWLPLAATAQSSPPQWQIEARPITHPTFEVAPTAEALPQWQAVPEPRGDRPWQPATPEELAQPILPPVAEQAPTPVIAEEPQYRIPPLMRPPTRLFNLETANILPEQTLELRGGIRNYDPQVAGGGGGLQIFYGSIDYAINHRLQVSFSGNYYDDPLGRLVKGLQPDLQFGAIAAGLKYQVHRGENLSVAVAGSLEAVRVRSDNFLFVPGAARAGTWTVAASLQAPITYSFNPQLQWHFTPNLTYFPDTVNKGGEFYGTNFNFGTGISWQPHPRFNLFADVNMPVGPGGNAVRSSDGAIVNLPVWSAGVRFLVNPAVSIDLAATNAFGITPASRTLAFLPGADQVGVMAGLSYTPNMGPDFAPPFLPSFRSGPRQPLTDRDRQLLLNGLTLTSPSTLDPGMLHLRGNSGTTGTGFQVGFGLAYDAQFAIAIEQWERGETLIENLNYSGNLQLGLAAKLRFLDQTQGDPFSLAFQGSFNRGIKQGGGGSRSLGGLELAFMYEPTKNVALLLNPKLGIFTPNQKVVGGIGVGLNVEVVRNLQFIAEATPVFGQTGVYSAGLRYVVPQWGLGIDLYGSTAVGSSIPNAGLVGQGSPGVGVNLHWLFGGSRPQEN
ncbi:hypothetical protein RHP47_09495 [Thermosynechococcus sp. QKsg1]|uniref:hypothetical protein n=1 Tax=Thermosynechococcus sp. QKsg1 TaxID=3074130 RepID=UPI0028773745|nr:hypothetical protein [Thermosynechococcus sp. QKsg1]WNC86076.1 hypothetical protein RHP47_09495 [Thermosynechococcus sp. QKsg1]